MQWWPLQGQTATNMTTNVTATKVAQKPRWKWSGSDEPQSYYRHEDNDTVTLTVDEQRRIQYARRVMREKATNVKEFH